MIAKGYYDQQPLRGHITVTRLSQGIPTVFELYLSHDISGVIRKSYHKSVDEALTIAMKHGFIRSLWQLHEIKFESLEDGVSK